MANQGPWGGGGGGNGGRDDGDRDKKPAGRPWGEQPPPGGPRRPNNDPQRPEIEDLMKKGQERLRVLMGGRGTGGTGGGGGGGRSPMGPNFGLNRSTLVVAGLAAVGLWAFASFYRVQTNSRSSSCSAAPSPWGPRV